MVWADLSRKTRRICKSRSTFAASGVLCAYVSQSETRLWGCWNYPRSNLQVGQLYLHRVQQTIGKGGGQLLLLCG